MDGLYYDQVRKKLITMRERLHTFYHEVQQSEQVKKETEEKLNMALDRIKEGVIEVGVKMAF